MPVPLVLLSERARRTIALLSSLVCLLSLPGSLALIATGVYIKYAVEDKIRLMEDFNTEALPAVVIVAGIVNFIQSGVCGVLMLTVQKVKKRAKLSRTLFFGAVTGLVAVVWLFTVTGLCSAHVTMLTASFDKGILSALGRYKTESTLKEEMDTLQIEYDCCGSKDYKDWFRVSWVDLSSLAGQLGGDRTGLPEDYKTDDVPFSCCNPASQRPCIHQHVLNTRRHFNYDPQVTVTLHKRGCTDALMEDMGKLLRGIGSAVLAAACIQLLNTSLLRLMGTSLSRAVASGNFEKTTNGWLFNMPNKYEGAEKGEPTGEEAKPLLSGGSTTQGSATSGTSSASQSTFGGSNNSSITSASQNLSDVTTDDGRVYDNLNWSKSNKRTLGPRPDQTLPPIPSGERNASNKRFLARPRQAGSSMPGSPGLWALPPPPSVGSRGLPYRLSYGEARGAGESWGVNQNNPAACWERPQTLHVHEKPQRAHQCGRDRPEGQGPVSEGYGTCSHSNDPLGFQGKASDRRDPYWPIDVALEPYHVTDERLEPHHVAKERHEPQHAIDNKLESYHVINDRYQHHHLTNDRIESHHMKGDKHEPHHVTNSKHESHHVTSDRLVPCQTTSKRLDTYHVVECEGEGCHTTNDKAEPHPQLQARSEALWKGDGAETRGSSLTADSAAVSWPNQVTSHPQQRTLPQGVDVMFRTGSRPPDQQLPPLPVEEDRRHRRQRTRSRERPSWRIHGEGAESLLPAPHHRHPARPGDRPELAASTEARNQDGGCGLGVPWPGNRWVRADGRRWGVGTEAEVAASTSGLGRGGTPGRTGRRPDLHACLEAATQSNVTGGGVGRTCGHEGRRQSTSREKVSHPRHVTHGEPRALQDEALVRRRAVPPRDSSRHRAAPQVCSPPSYPWEDLSPSLGRDKRRPPPVLGP